MKVAIPKTKKTTEQSRKKQRTKRSKSFCLPTPQTPTQLDESGKLSILQCKAILCKDGVVYSDEQVIVIRQVLYTLADVDYKYHFRQKDHKQTANIPILTTQYEQQDRYSLHPRIYGRTG